MVESRAPQTELLSNALVNLTNCLITLDDKQQRSMDTKMYNNFKETINLIIEKIKINIT